MSELREHLFVPYSELQEGDELTDAITIAKSYYLKSEADKVIAEKDNVIAELKDKLQNVSELLTKIREWLVESQKMHQRCVDGAIKKIRHQKYKRCLALVKYCHESAMWFEEYGITKSATFMLRWQKRWLRLAEKFKEAK